MLLYNLVKIAIWIAALILSIHFWGWIGGLVFGIVTPCWDLIWTILLTDQRDKVFRTIFSRPVLPFTVYGCYCSPKYGLDGDTHGIAPIDGLDQACKEHDYIMLKINEEAAGVGEDVSKETHVRIKNRYDWEFMKKVLKSHNSASGIYLLGLEAGFLCRIILRSVLR